MIKSDSARTVVLGLIMGAALLGGGSLGACKGLEKAPTAAVPDPAAGPTVAPAEEWTVDKLAPVLGKAESENSGIFDLAGGKGELIVTYHFYEARKKGLDERMGQDLAPKIQALYRKFPGLDRITFKIEVYEQRDVVLWRPYCSFVTTRKIIDDTDWTSLLLKDFFGIVQELAYAE